MRAGKDVFIKEIESAGFRRMTHLKPLVMKENFFVSFEKAVSSARQCTDRHEAQQALNRECPGDRSGVN